KCGTVRIATGTYPMADAYLGKCALLEAQNGPVLLTVPTISATRAGLGGLRRQPDGTIAMRFSGTAGRRYQILSSTDLATWDLWKEFIAVSDSFDIIHY